jgi:hypothetical protein
VESIYTFNNGIPVTASIPTGVVKLNIEAWGGGGGTRAGSPAAADYSIWLCAGANGATYTSASYNTSGVTALQITIGSAGGTGGQDGTATTVEDVDTSGLRIHVVASGGTGTGSGACTVAAAQSFTLNPAQAISYGVAGGFNIVSGTKLIVFGNNGTAAWTASIPANPGTETQIIASGGFGGAAFGSGIGGQPGILSTTNGGMLAASYPPTGAGGGAGGCLSVASKTGIVLAACPGTQGANGMVRIRY